MVNQNKGMLTPRQQAVWQFIRDYWNQHGVSPTYGEIQNRFGFKSPNSVTNFLKALEKKGLIRLIRGQKRHILPIQQDPLEKFSQTTEGIEIPIGGVVSAGGGITWVDPEDKVKGRMWLDWPGFKKKSLASGLIWLEVQGHSLIDAQIQPGDWLLVKPVVHWQPDGRLYLIRHAQHGLMAKFLWSRLPDGLGQSDQLPEKQEPDHVEKQGGIWVLSANPNYPPWFCEPYEITVLARVVAHWRWI